MEAGSQSDDNEEHIKRLLATLDFCRQWLPTDIHHTHLQRLTLIAQILTLRTDSPTGEILLFSPAPPRSLEWELSGNEFIAQTEHGRAVILENRIKKWGSYGSSISHAPRLELPLKVILKGPESMDFMAAERWMIERLHALNHPTGGELDLENLQVTLQLCQHALPPRSDPIHRIHLEWIDSEISDILL